MTSAAGTIFAFGLWNGLPGWKLSKKSGTWNMDQMGKVTLAIWSISALVHPELGHANYDVTNAVVGS